MPSAHIEMIPGTTCRVVAVAIDLYLLLQQFVGK
jgi:hypothetical protein